MLTAFQQEYTCTLSHAEINDSGLCRLRALVVLPSAILMNDLFSSNLDSFYILKSEKGHLR